MAQADACARWGVINAVNLEKDAKDKLLIFFNIVNIFTNLLLLMFCGFFVSKEWVIVEKYTPLCITIPYYQAKSHVTLVLDFINNKAKRKK